MLTLPARGRCQCESVRYELTAQPFVAYTCHCLACQRLSSSAFITCIQVPAEALQITAGSPAVSERTTDTGNVSATRFCSGCGSAIFSQNSARPRIRAIYVGTLDEAAAVQVSAHIWVKRKLPWVVLPAGHRIFDEAGDWSADYGAEIGRYRPGPAKP